MKNIFWPRLWNTKKKTILKKTNWTIKLSRLSHYWNQSMKMRSRWSHFCRRTELKNQNIIIKLSFLRFGPDFWTRWYIFHSAWCILFIIVRLISELKILLFSILFSLKGTLVATCTCLKLWTLVIDISTHQIIKLSVRPTWQIGHIMNNNHQ